MYEGLAGSDVSQRAEWIAFDQSGPRATVTAVPDFGDVSLPVDVGAVVAFLNR